MKHTASYFSYNKIPVRTEYDATNIQLQLLRESMKTVLEPLGACLRPAYLVNVGEKTSKLCSYLIFSFCDFPDGKDISGIKHGRTTYPCISCPMTKHGILNPKAGATWRLQRRNTLFEIFQKHYIVSRALSENGMRRDSRSYFEKSGSILDVFTLEVKDRWQFKFLLWLNCRTVFDRCSPRLAAVHF